MMVYAGKVLMVVENHIPWDKRPFREAKVLVEQGYEVSIICLKAEEQTYREEIDGVSVYRLPTLTLTRKTLPAGAGPVKRMGALLFSIAAYLIEYFYFSSMALLMSGYVLVKKGFDVVHVHNPPDTLFPLGILCRMTGKKFVFDHHDLSPELYLSRYERKEDLVSRVLLFLEILNLRLAHLVIATNESYREIEIARGKISPEKIEIVRNGPDHNKLKPSGKPSGNAVPLLVYVGVMGPQDGVDYLLRALHRLRNDLGREDFQCVVIGTGDQYKDLVRLCGELELENHVRFTGFIPDKEFKEIMAKADIGMSPDPSSPLNDQSTWIKVLEYMAIGIPIVAFDLKETRFSAREAALYAEPNDELDFARAIARLLDDPKMREKMGAYGRKRIEEELNWSVTSKNLVRAYVNMMVGRGGH